MYMVEVKISIGEILACIGAYMVEVPDQPLRYEAWMKRASCITPIK